MDEKVCYLVGRVLVHTRVVDLLASIFLRMVRSGSAGGDDIKRIENGLVEVEKAEEGKS